MRGLASSLIFVFCPGLIQTGLLEEARQDFPRGGGHFAPVVRPVVDGPGRGNKDFRQRTHAAVTGGEGLPGFG
jgi:hypothetical protein